MQKNKSKNPIFEILDSHKEYKKLSDSVKSGLGPFSVFGLCEAHRSHIIASLFCDSQKPMLVVTSSQVSANKMHEALSSFFNDEECCLMFEASELIALSKSYAHSKTIEAKRSKVLSYLYEAKKVIVTACAEALLQTVMPPEIFAENTITLNTGDTIEPLLLTERLVKAGYEICDVCEAPGQAARRGGLVDVFPIASENPVRIEFFDDEIDTLREYDALSQRSIDNISDVLITPMPNHYNGTATLRDYFPKDSIIVIDEPSRVEESAKIAYSMFLEAVSARIEAKSEAKLDEKLVASPLSVITSLDTNRTIMCMAFSRAYPLIASKGIFRFDTKAAILYKNNFEVLASDLEQWRKSGYTVIIYASTHATHLKDALSDFNILLPVKDSLDRSIISGEHLIVSQSLSMGFEYPDLKLAVLTENELFASVKKATRTKARKRPSLVFSELEVNSLVVHELHGIGRFVGVVTLDIGGILKDYLHIVYAGGDKLYIPTDQLDRVQKYIGGDQNTTALSKLGSGEWQKTVSRTRESAKKLAFDLVKLYGERHRQKGFAFSKDTPWQVRLEASFPYTETPDQLTSLEEIKKDMEQLRPMDRLLCGDVGYGKTEVALRAAFKAVMDSKQVAFLVPTTILAQQHYNTIASRFSSFPVQVAMYSRFTTPSEEKKIIEGLKNGMIDVLVGTHRLLSKNVEFLDLGLLIIDEEQRFGVGHKEQIKNLKKNIDVLTLSATPIPRTLHMSMAGIRDMSVIDTPPEERHPVQTYVMQHNDEIIREAILKEVGRGGQVYFVSNNVKGMAHTVDKLKELVPEVRISHAHGQMGERALENAMLSFMRAESDVLVCSTIIESGLDIPNVNTIIITNANSFGLSQLYQLRGRVGRSTRLGYAYLMFDGNYSLSETSMSRLNAMSEFTDFGSGFKIAMRDLEIRGAGNLLGAEQSGHMAAVGYDLYCKIIDGAVKEATGQKVEKEIETTVEIPIAASIPHSYIPRENERMSMYKRIAMINGKDSLYDVQDELLDRYGDIPNEVGNLLTISLIKAYANKAYIVCVSVKDEEVKLTFSKDAKLNTDKLLDIITSTDGARLYQGESPSLVIKQKRKKIAELCSWLPQFVYTLSNCIEGDS